MIKKTLVVLAVCGLALALWRIYGSGGNIGDFFNTIWSVFYTVIDAVANVFVTAWDTVFGVAE